VCVCVCVCHLGPDTARLFCFIPLFRPILFLFFISSATASHAVAPRRLFSLHMCVEAIRELAVLFMLLIIWFHGFCPMRIVLASCKRWSAYFICFYFHLPPQSLLTVCQHWMVTLQSVQPEFSPWRGWWYACSGDRNSCEERSLHYH